MALPGSAFDLLVPPRALCRPHLPWVLVWEFGERPSSAGQVTVDVLTFRGAPAKTSLACRCGNTARVRTVAWLALVLLAFALAGCGRSAAFYRGEELLRRGKEREAYFEFWQAYREDRLDVYLTALESVGSRVASEERDRGRRRERERDFSGALEHYSLGLEYEEDWEPLRQDYARVARWREEWLQLERELAVVQSGGPRSAPDGAQWRGYELLLRLAAHPARPAGWSADVLASAREAARAEIRVLRRRTPAPFPAESVPLRRLLADWGHFEARLRRHALRLEEGRFLLPSVTHVPGEVNLVLREFLRDAEQVRSQLEQALEGCSQYEHAAHLERQGDLLSAREIYAHVSLLHDGLEAARDARARVERLFLTRSYERARLAIHSRDWKEAYDQLRRLLGVAPQYRDALELFSAARQKLSGSLALQARRYREAGLLGNALMRFRLAHRLAPGADVLGRSAELIEEALTRRLRPRVRLVVDTDADELSSRWGVDRWVGERLVDRVIQDAEETLEVAVSNGLPSGEDWPRETLEIGVEFDAFEWSREHRTVGAGRTRALEEFERVPNPALEEARQELRRAEVVLHKRLSEQKDAPGFARDELVRLAQWNVRAAKTRVAAIETTTLTLKFRDVPFAVEAAVGEAGLRARFRLQGQEGAARVGVQFEDRVVPPADLATIPRDPVQLPSRAKTLDGLVGHLGPRLAEEILVALERRNETLYNEGLARYEAGAFDRAVESLVAFVHARRGRGGDRVDHAEEILARLTGTGTTDGPTGEAAPRS